MREVRTVCPMIIIYSLVASFKDFNDPRRPPGLHSQGDGRTDGRTDGSSSSSSVFVSLRARCVCVCDCVCV